MIALEEELLTSVRVLLRHALPPELQALQHVTMFIHQYLDCSVRYTLEQAADAGFLHMMARLAAQEWHGVGPEFRADRLSHGARKAAANGRLDVLQWWIGDYFPYQKIERQIYKAAVLNDQGHLHVIQWLHKRSGLFLNERCVTSIVYMHSHIVYWLHEQGCRFKLTVDLTRAVETGDLTYIKWIYARKGLFDVLELCEYDMDAAASNGHVDVLEYLHVRYPNLDPCWIVRSKPGYSSIAVLTWIHKAYPDLLLMRAMTDTEDPELIRWILRNYRWKGDMFKRIWVDRVLTYAAKCGNIDILSLLWPHRDFLICSSALDYAAQAGKLEALQWLHVRGAMGVGRAMHLAAANGNYEIVKWLHENREIGSSVKAMDYAASNNHLRVVQWLHENRTEGCSTRALDFAAGRGNLTMAQWLCTNRTEGCTTRAMNKAAERGFLAVVQYLHVNTDAGCTIDAMNKAAANGRLSIVRWLHENRSEGCTSQAMDAAAENGHLNVVQYLHEHRSEGCTTAAMERAAANGHLNVVRWLHAHRSEGCRRGIVNIAAANGRLEVVKYLVTHCNQPCSAKALKRATLNGHFNIQEWILKYEYGRSKSDEVKWM